MSVKEQYWKYSLITIILGLGLILFIKMSPFIGGILGACTIYIMVRKQMFYLTQEKHFKVLSKILCKWKQDSVVSLFLYLDSVFKYKHKLVHNQSPV